MRKAAEALARGERPPSIYLAGYYFNEALLRLDIAYENLLRRITRRRNESADELIDLAAIKYGLDRRSFTEWLRIRDEVNGLKHRNPEQIERHRRGGAVAVKTVISALTTLIPLIESVCPGRG